MSQFTAVCRSGSPSQLQFATHTDPGRQVVIRSHPAGPNNLQSGKKYNPVKAKKVCHDKVSPWLHPPPVRPSQTTQHFPGLQPTCLCLTGWWVSESRTPHYSSTSESKVFTPNLSVYKPLSSQKEEKKKPWKWEKGTQLSTSQVAILYDIPAWGPILSFPVSGKQLMRS